MLCVLPTIYAFSHSFKRSSPQWLKCLTWEILHILFTIGALQLGKLLVVVVKMYANLLAQVAPNVLEDNKAGRTLLY